jgi:phage regulator Rha-like protein
MNSSNNKRNTVAATQKSIEDSVVVFNGQPTILDSDVAEFYGVETREINQAIKNNEIKFPESYVIQLNNDEWRNLKSKILTSSWGGKNKPPRLLTEKGLYMLATILKGEKAALVTIQIIETFAALREAGRAINEMSLSEDQPTKEGLGKKVSVLVGDILGKSLPVEAVETEFNFNLLAVKIKHKVSRGGKNE